MLILEEEKVQEEAEVPSQQLPLREGGKMKMEERERYTRGN